MHDRLTEFLYRHGNFPFYDDAADYAYSILSAGQVAGDSFTLPALQAWDNRSHSFTF